MRTQGRDIKVGLFELDIIFSFLYFILLELEFLLLLLLFVVAVVLLLKIQYLNALH